VRKIDLGGKRSDFWVSPVSNRQITRSTAWTNTVRNRFRQKTGEIEAFRALETGAAKWCKEHIPRKDNNPNDITKEGISLLDDAEL
jgi:hemerythrin